MLPWIVVGLVVGAAPECRSKVTASGEALALIAARCGPKTVTAIAKVSTSTVVADAVRLMVDALVESHRAPNGLEPIAIECVMRCRRGHGIACRAAEYATRRVQEHERWIDDQMSALVALACSSQRVIDEAEFTMKTEHEVGRVSGYVDKVVIHEAGARIVAGRKMLEVAKREYQKTTGKPLDLEDWDCPKVDE